MLFLFKSIMCSLVFWSFYRFMLQQESMFTFNRFYLIGSLLLSFILPVITYETIIVETLPAFNISDEYVVTESITEKSYWNLDHTLWAVYLIVAFYFFLKFAIGLWRVLQKVNRGKRQLKEGFSFVLIADKDIPQTFLRNVIVNEEDYANGEIQTEIIQHEIAHAQQLHTVDVILVEVLKILFWFNPAVYLFANSIRANHEYLADASVLKQTNNVSFYQQLLLRKITENSIQNQFTSSLTYKLTKNRFVMMTKQTTTKRMAFKTSGTLIIIAISFFSFTKTSIAQSGASPEEVEQYVEIILDNFDQHGNAVDILEEDAKQLHEIYAKMDKGQRIILDELEMPCPTSLNGDVPPPPAPPTPPAPPAPEDGKHEKLSPPPPPKFPSDAKYFIDGKEVTFHEANVMRLNYKHYKIKLKKGEGNTKDEFHINRIKD